MIPTLIESMTRLIEDIDWCKDEGNCGPHARQNVRALLAARPAEKADDGSAVARTETARPRHGAEARLHSERIRPTELAAQLRDDGCIPRQLYRSREVRRHRRRQRWGQSMIPRGDYQNHAYPVQNSGKDKGSRGMICSAKLACRTRAVDFINLVLHRASKSALRRGFSRTAFGRAISQIVALPFSCRTANGVYGFLNNAVFRHMRLFIGKLGKVCKSPCIDVRDEVSWEERCESGEPR
ncbi:hypothetical protein [Paraburkholderia dinghuensis]|uniref:hypothetical protein n=1 Tax=Paraburkholderia dinghuensis TaxID=2305225 RepID=UPI0016273FDF|nr:hypothetical protein [Paraburkholderia dinghuensis]